MHQVIRQQISLLGNNLANILGLPVEGVYVAVGSLVFEVLYKLSPLHLLIRTLRGEPRNRNYRFNPRSLSRSHLRRIQLRQLQGRQTRLSTLVLLLALPVVDEVEGRVDYLADVLRLVLFNGVVRYFLEEQGKVVFWVEGLGGH